MALTNAYCTLEQVRDALGINDASDDPMLELAVNAASRHIDGFCGQRFWLDEDATAREFYVTGAGDVWLDQSDVAGIGTLDDFAVGVDTSGTGTFSTALTVDEDFLLLPRNALVTVPASPYTSLGFGLSGGSWSPRPSYNGRPSLLVTGRWGWPAVPDDVAQACVLQAIQLFKARDAAFGVAAFGEFGALRVRGAMNPIAEGLLAPFRRMVVA